MDHYCAFIGNVVAKGSYKYFFLFLFYIFIQCALGVILIMKYSITNNLQYHIPLSPIRTLIYKNTFMMRTLFAWIMIDPNKGDWNGWTRDYIGLNGLNYTTNEYIYPEGIPPGDNYWIETGIKDFNLAWIIFMTGMAIRVINNIKNGQSTVLLLKMKRDKSIVS